MNNTKILLKQIIEEKIKNENLEINLDKLTDIYLKEVSENTNLKSLYEKALSYLSQNDFESSLNYLIVTLDINNNHQESLHLCKNILYNIGVFLVEKKADIYKQKYGNLREANHFISTKYKDLQEQLKTSKENLAVQEKNRFSRDSKSDPKQIIQNIVEHKRSILNTDMELKKYQKDIEIIDKLYKMETYGKIINVILEVCILPELYEN